MGFLDDYQPVEDRLREFWRDHPDGRINTFKQPAPDGEYIFIAGAYREQDDEEPAATGYAHESVAQLPQNMKASALEVCETSSIGRCLANLGYAPKGKRPSREEMTKTSATGDTPVSPVAEHIPPADEKGQGQEGPAGGTPKAGEVLAQGKGEASPADGYLWQEIFDLVDGDKRRGYMAVTKANKRTPPVKADNAHEVTDMELHVALIYLKGE